MSSIYTWYIDEGPVTIRIRPKGIAKLGAITFIQPKSEELLAVDRGGDASSDIVYEIDGGLRDYLLGNNGGLIYPWLMTGLVAANDLESPNHTWGYDIRAEQQGQPIPGNDSDGSNNDPSDGGFFESDMFGFSVGQPLARGYLDIILVEG